MHCRREYNALVKSTAGEVAELKAVQQKAMAEQMKLDEASLQRLEAEKEAAKVPLCSLCSRYLPSNCLLPLRTLLRAKMWSR